MNYELHLKKLNVEMSVCVCVECIGLGKLIDGCAPTQQSEGAGEEEGKLNGIIKR